MQMKKPNKNSIGNCDIFSPLKRGSLYWNKAFNSKCILINVLFHLNTLIKKHMYILTKMHLMVLILDSSVFCSTYVFVFAELFVRKLKQIEQMQKCVTYIPGENNQICCHKPLVWLLVATIVILTSNFWRPFEDHAIRLCCK